MEYVWTSHAKYKMRYYRLSESRVKRVIGNPARVEEGIAEDTVAMMQPAGTKAHPYEIWVMLSRSSANVIASSAKQSREKPELKVISAWRYPGVTKLGEPLPKEIIVELRAAIR